MQYQSQEVEEDRIILDEELDPDYEPTDEEMKEYAKFIGMDLEKEGDLLYLAREALKAPLAAGWNACKTAEGLIYFFNFDTGESKWDSPLDEYYRTKLREARSVRNSKTPPRSSERKQVRFSSSNANLQQAPSLKLFQRHSNSLPNIQTKAVVSEKPSQINFRTPDKEGSKSQNSRSASKPFPTELRAKIPVLQEKTSNVVEEKDIQKKLNGYTKQRDTDLQEFKEKKDFDFERRKKQELKKFESQLSKMMGTIEEDLGIERLRQEVQLDSKVMDRFEKDAREYFAAESKAIFDNFVLESTSLQENYSRVLKQKREDRAREMTQHLATNMRDLEDEINRKKKRIEEVKNLKILKKKKELQEYILSVEKEKDDLSSILKNKLKEIDKSQLEWQETEFLLYKEKLAQELDHAKEMSEREHEAEVQELRDQIESEYRKKFDFAKMDLREELQRIVPTYEITTRKALDVALAEEIKESLRQKYKLTEDFKGLDQIIYSQTLKQKLADLQGKLKSDFETMKQEWEQAERDKINMMNDEINLMREQIKAANEIRAMMQKYADEAVVASQTMQSKETELKTLVQGANLQLDSLENVGNQFEELDKEKAEAKEQSVIAKDVDDLNKKISNKSKSISTLRADRPLYERPLVTENLEDVAASALVNSEELASVKKDLENAKESLRTVLGLVKT